MYTCIHDTCIYHIDCWSMVALPVFNNVSVCTSHKNCKKHQPDLSLPWNLRSTNLYMTLP